MYIEYRLSIRRISRFTPHLRALTHAVLDNLYHMLKLLFYETILENLQIQVFFPSHTLKPLLH